MNTKKLRYSLIALALSAPAGVVQAGDNYVTLGAGFVGTGGGGIIVSSNPVLKTFTLPTGTFTGTQSTRFAVLQLDVSGQTDGKDEVYLNPPTTTCTADVGDANQTKSLGSLSNGFNHITFASNKLIVGSNTLMFCARNNLGTVVPPLDNYIVSDIVLHYQTN